MCRARLSTEHQHTHSLGYDRGEMDRDIRTLPAEELAKKYRSDLVLEYKAMLDASSSKAGTAGSRTLTEAVIIEHEED